MNFFGPRARLTPADLQSAADTLECSLAAIKAVLEVESAGSGFLGDGRPKILFEAHIFSKLTSRKFDESHPHISAPKWTRALYRGGAKEYERLEAAMLLSESAALMSASWGLFQILGINHKLCGCKSVEDFVQLQVSSERDQLSCFLNFIKKSHLDDELREGRWADFARIYNGPSYSQNRYDIRLARSFEKYHKLEEEIIPITMDA